VKTGVQEIYNWWKELDSGLRRNDGKTFFLTFYEFIRLVHPIFYENRISSKLVDRSSLWKPGKGPEGKVPPWRDAASIGGILLFITSLCASEGLLQRSFYRDDIHLNLLLPPEKGERNRTPDRPFGQEMVEVIDAGYTVLIHGDNKVPFLHARLPGRPPRINGYDFDRLISRQVVVPHQTAIQLPLPGGNS
jgi:hypothetical protein